MPILATVTSASSILLGKDVLTLRPFSSKVDSENLSELCKDVWDGTDYLPNVAPLFVDLRKMLNLDKFLHSVSLQTSYKSRWDAMSSGPKSFILNRIWNLCAPSHHPQLRSFAEWDGGWSCDICLLCTVELQYLWKDWKECQLVPMACSPWWRWTGNRLCDILFVDDDDIDLFLLCSHDDICQLICLIIDKGITVQVQWKYPLST